MKKRKATEGEQLSLALDASSAPVSLTSALDQDINARRLQLGSESVAYRLRRSKRRTIGFQIDDHGLTVSAPRWVSQREVEAAIAEKQRWVHNKLVEWREWRAKRQLPQVCFVDGGSLPYLGRPVRLRLDSSARSTQLIESEQAQLLIALPPHATELQVRDAVQAWLQSQARLIFDQRLQLISKKLELRYSAWTLSSARSQWGSCTHDGRIRLNWRLMHFPLAVIDYVVAHELAHLKEMNHSARFWDTVARLMPEFEPARAQLKQQDLTALL